MTLAAESMQRLRIAVLSRTFSPSAGGAERYSIALVEQLAAGHEIHVFAQAIDHAWPQVTYHHVSMPLRRPRWINQLWFATATWWATRKGFDVVHSHENTWHGDVQTVHVLPVKHTLFVGREGWQQVARWVKVLTSPRLLAYLWLERMRYAVRENRRVVVISESLRTFFSVTYPGAVSMVSLITPGIALPRFPSAVNAKQQARVQLGLPPDRPCVLFVGNDFRKKGLTALLAAVRSLPDDVVLAVCGNSAQLPAFRELAHEAGLAGRVFFLGAMNDVTPAYEAADCLAHPTLEDTFAMVVLEAMSHGLPVVISSSQYCGIAGSLDDGKNALILQDPRDAAAIAAALSRLLGDKEFSGQLGKNARNFAEKFEWREIASLQDDVYQAIASAKAGKAMVESSGPVQAP